jgi:MFS family permease
VFYGWRIVGVTFLTHFISVGFLFYSYGAFFKALAEEFGGSRLGVATGMAIVNVVTAAFAPFLGRLLDRGSIRNVMCVGALLMASGFLLVSRIEALWQFYLVLGTLIGIGSSMLGGLAGSTLVSNWFTARRGTALGIATMGISLSGMVMAPLATWLIAEFGWRSTFVVYAGVAVVVILPVAWWLIVNRPEDLGLLPDGLPPPAERTPLPAPALRPLAPGAPLTHPPARGAGSARSAWSARRSLRNPNFWAITLAVSFSFCASSAVLTHIIPHATDIGLDPLAAATVLSVMAGIGMIGKVMFGWLTDRVSHRGALWLAIGLQAIGMGLFMRATEYGSLLGAAAVFGLGMGGLMPLWGAAIGAAFGRLAFGRVMGLMSPFMIPIQTIGIPFAGWMFDRTGSYDLAFTSLIGFYVLAFASVTFLRIPDIEPDSEPLMSPV